MAAVIVHTQMHFLKNLIIELEVGLFQVSSNFKLAMDQSHSGLQLLTWSAKLEVRLRLVNVTQLGLKVVH